MQGYNSGYEKSYGVSLEGTDGKVFVVVKIKDTENKNILIRKKFFKKSECKTLFH